jgi:hypothetical protein
MCKVQRIGTHPRARGRIVVHLAQVAVLAIVAADRICRRDNSCPDLRSRAFRRGLVAKCRRSLHAAILITLKASLRVVARGELLP